MALVPSTLTRDEQRSLVKTSPFRAWSNDEIRGQLMKHTQDMQGATVRVFTALTDEQRREARAKFNDDMASNNDETRQQAQLVSMADIERIKPNASRDETLLYCEWRCRRLPMREYMIVKQTLRIPLQDLRDDVARFMRTQSKAAALTLGDFMAFLVGDLVTDAGEADAAKALLADRYGTLSAADVDAWTTAELDGLFSTLDNLFFALGYRRQGTAEPDAVDRYSARSLVMTERILQCLRQFAPATVKLLEAMKDMTVDGSLERNVAIRQDVYAFVGARLGPGPPLPPDDVDEAAETTDATATTVSEVAGPVDEPPAAESSTAGASGPSSFVATSLVSQ
jgi:hypothetical protein